MELPEPISIERILNYRSFGIEASRQMGLFDEAYKRAIALEIDQMIDGKASSPDLNDIKLKFYKNGWHYSMSESVFKTIPEPCAMHLLKQMRLPAKDCVYHPERRMRDANLKAKDLSEYLNQLNIKKKEEAEIRETRRQAGEAVEEPEDYFTEDEKIETERQISDIFSHVAAYNKGIDDFCKIAPKYPGHTACAGLEHYAFEFNEMIAALSNPKYDESLACTAECLADSAGRIHYILSQAYFWIGNLSRIAERGRVKWTSNAFAAYLRKRGFSVKIRSYATGQKPSSATIEKSKWKEIRRREKEN